MQGDHFLLCIQKTEHRKFYGNEISINLFYETLQSVSDKNIEAIANFHNGAMIIQYLIERCSNACCYPLLSEISCLSY